MKAQMETLLRRARAYRFADGLVELGAGAIFLGAAVFGYLEYFVVLKRPFSAIYVAVEPFASLAWILAVIVLVDMARQRISSPRTGFVEPAPAGLRASLGQVAVGLLAAALLGLIVWQFARQGWARNGWVLPVLAVILGVGLGWLGAGLRLKRFMLLGLWSGVLGIILSLTLMPGAPVARGLYLVLSGAAWLVSGSLTLVQYLRAHPEPVKETP